MSRAERIKFNGEDLDAILEEAYERNWTDGLPIVPPTPERVDRMMATSGRLPEEVVAILAPRNAQATVEKIAINAVMAGCRPDYFPVVLAAVEAMAEPKFELYGINTTTNPVAPMVIVNGPIRDQIGLNYRYSLLGPGCRANATIGRAISLININIAGRIPGTVSKSTQAQPGRYTMCVAEYEESSPWDPLHVDRGFARDQSTVTMMAPTGTTNVLDTNSKTGEGILTTVAHSMEIVGSVNMYPFFGLGEMLVIFCSDHANVIARDGFSRKDVQQFLFEATSRIPLAHWPAEKHHWLVESGRSKGGLTPLANRPEQFQIMVAGGDGGFHSVVFPTFGDSYAVTKAIQT